MYILIAVNIIHNDNLYIVKIALMITQMLRLAGYTAAETASASIIVYIILFT